QSGRLYGECFRIMALEEDFDCIIIGAGAAGISCALELHDVGLNYVVLEKGNKIGHQLSDIPNTIKNFSGGFFENGEAFRIKMAAAAEHIGCKYRLKQVIGKVDLNKLTIEANGQKLKATTMLLATGCRRRRLELAGEEVYANEVS